MANIACERLIEAGRALHNQGLSTFRRVDLRNWIMDKYPDVTKKQWKNTYNPSIQAMKKPRPEHPPPVGQKYRDIFQWYKEDHTYALTQYDRRVGGCELVSLATQESHNQTTTGSDFEARNCDEISRHHRRRLATKTAITVARSAFTG